MTSTSVSCNDDRVALARRGALSPAEWQGFATHLTVCLDCRVAWRLAGDFEQSAAARAGDERIVARAVKAALGASARPQRNVLRLALAVSVVLLAAGAASAAIVLHGRHRQPAEPAAVRDHLGATKSRGVRSQAPVSPPPTESPVAPTAEIPATPPDRGPAPAPPAAPSAVPARLGPERAKTRSAIVPPELARPNPFGEDSPLSPPPPRQVDARGLLARALAERRAGRTDAAIATFRQLHRELPDSPEAAVSLVSLGNLLLEDGSPAEALRDFESYLRLAPTGTLVPEAWVGKARALDAMGRTTQASAVWDEIAKRFPDTGYVRP